MGGLNALGCAAMQGHSEIVKLAYQHLMNVKNPQEIVDFVNAGDGVNGWTPLHLACMGGHENVIKFLINVVKVDIFKKDYENKTGLEHAWQNGHLPSVVVYTACLRDPRLCSARPLFCDCNVLESFLCHLAPLFNLRMNEWIYRLPALI